MGTLEGQHDHVYRTWQRGMRYMASGDGHRALYVFEMLPRWPTVSFNKAMIHLSLNEPEAALSCLDHAVACPPNFLLPVSAFQRGVVRFRREEYPRALEDFSLAFHRLDGRKLLDCRPVGLDFCLYGSEVLFNIAMSLTRMGKFDEGVSVLSEARRWVESDGGRRPGFRKLLDVPADGGEEQQQEEQGQEGAGADYWRVFQVPPGVLCRPPASRAPFRIPCVPARPSTALVPHSNHHLTTSPSSPSSSSSSSSCCHEEEEGENSCPSTTSPVASPLPFVPPLLRKFLSLSSSKRSFFK
ncbi:hypothetical protein VP01_2483g4 [Puccinia sorghi]|uniref:Uncharacterized protein n=1 Tax=Puccinia sorghi TaxID=27349 RepID=A0A0L6V614_9BASI|nr:hypothetical protein VP01_2483g4 [Puccinia sorghi]